MKNFNIFWVHRKIRVSGFYLKKKKKRSKEEERFEKEKLYKWKNKCICEKPHGKCEAIGLNEYRSCHFILKTQCTKQANHWKVVRNLK